jgi:hypothetical protein
VSVHFGENPLAVQPTPIAPGLGRPAASSFVAGAPNSGLFAHVAQRITTIGIGQGERIITERTELKAELTMREEADDD